MPLLALRVQVPHEAADALSDALLEQGAQSVSIEALDDPEAEVCAIFAGNADPRRALEEALACCGARSDRPYTVPAIEMTAMSVVPPPMSMTMFPAAPQSRAEAA